MITLKIKSRKPGKLSAVVIKMKYEDLKMEAYWNTLPPEIQSVINQAGIEICSLGMLQKLGDYYKNGNQVGSGE